MGKALQMEFLPDLHCHHNHQPYHPHMCNNHLGGRGEMISRGKGAEAGTGGGGAEGWHEDGDVAWSDKPTAPAAMWPLG
jgi:hypothetical protein